MQFLFLIIVKNTIVIKNYILMIYKLENGYKKWVHLKTGKRKPINY
jgi:hypothetical protein